MKFYVLILKIMKLHIMLLACHDFNMGLMIKAKAWIWEMGWEKCKTQDMRRSQTHSLSETESVWNCKKEEPASLPSAIPF